MNYFFLVAALFFSAILNAEDLPFISLTDANGRTVEVQITGPGVPGKGFPATRRDGRQVHIPLEILSGESIDAIANEMRRQSTGLPVGTTVAVQSLTIKQIDGKFRYFFRISNMTAKPFSGTVKITMQNVMKGVTNGGATAFDTSQAIPAGGATTVYVEKNTGPKAVHADASIIGFHYEVISDGASIANGSGSVPEDVVE